MTREVNIVYTPTLKQLQALEILEDKETTELLFGGSAGGGKSYLGCAWVILNCLRYAGTRYMIARAELKALKASTMKTFFQICNEWGLIKDEDFHYNPIDGVITFIKTQSEVYLKDLKEQPSDPEFSDLGSREYTGIFIDEGAEITIKAYNIAKSRIRFKLEKHGLIPKILICSNPYKNFLYYEFYKAHKNGNLPKYRKYLPALVQENPFISPYYIDNLKKLKGIDKERLLYGVWEYDETQNNLFEYEKILEMFEITLDGKNRYLTVDVARAGKDYTVIMQWRELYVEKIWVYKKQSIKQTRLVLEDIMEQAGIKKDHVIVDEDGVGGGLVDEMGVKGFINNARPLELKKEQNPLSAYTAPPKHNFANLKSQCYFHLASKVNKGEIGIYPAVNEQVKEMLIEDLEQIKRKDPDKDVKLAVVPKEEIKQNLGRSTDFGDCLMFRMYFEIKPPYKPYIA